MFVILVMFVIFEFLLFDDFKLCNVLFFKENMLKLLKLVELFFEFTFVVVLEFIFEIEFIIGLSYKFNYLK